MAGVRKITLRYVRWGIAALCLASSPMWHSCAGNGGAAPPRTKAEDRGVPVTVAKVVQKDVPIDLQVVGSVQASLSVAIKPQVGGQLTGVFFREGDFVKKGDLLFEIDKRTLQSQLNQSQANLSRDEAQLGLVRANLARDEAQQKYALEEVNRYSRMLKEGLVPAEQAEQVKANADAVSAAVNADQAAIRSAEAAVNASRASVENASVLLGYTEIRSPIDGRTGNLRVQQGNIVQANTTELITINQVEPIFVSFAVPETQLSRLRISQTVTATSRDASESPETGTLTFIDNAVDPATGTIRLKGTFANSNRKLWPGEFVRIKLNLATRRDALVVPSQAVQTGQDGQFVFVVKPDHTVESRPVVAGARIDLDTVIEKGLRPDEVVVTEGQLRLAPGSHVQISGGEDDSYGVEGGSGKHE